jgi:hypothetical protein
MRVSHLLLPLVSAIALAASAGRADAYPQFQLSTGTDTCHQCHFSPGGGGLINEYGRDEASDISMFQKGDGRFLHGLWDPPASFQIGVDLRVVGLGIAAKPDTATETFTFPMQNEIYLRPQVGKLSLYVAAGFRDSRGAFAPTSREHYLMYEDTEKGFYVRAGRFFPVFGLRLQDHTSFIRRNTQMYLYEEPYGVAYGKYLESSELHVSAFVRAFGALEYLGTAHDSGVAAYYERRNEDSTFAWGAQTKLTISDTDRRAWLGGTYKQWLEGAKVLLLGELDLAVETFPESGGVSPDPLLQTVAYAGASYMPMQGLMITPAVQHFDADAQHHGSSRNAVDLNVQWFAIPHLELHVLQRFEVEALDTSRPILLTLAQVHYYL